MKIPREFQRMISLMHADIDLVLSPEDDVFQYLLGGVIASERPIIARFIDTLLGSTLNEKELVMKLVEAGADVFVDEDDIVPFLTKLRDRLREQ